MAARRPCGGLTCIGGAELIRGDIFTELPVCCAAFAGQLHALGHHYVREATMRG